MTGSKWLRASVLLVSIQGFTSGLTVGCRTSGGDQSDLDFYGADSQSAEMTYSSYIEVELPSGVTNKDMLLKDPYRAQMTRILQKQVDHMFGVFTEHPEYVNNPGIIQTKGRPQITSADIDTTAGTARVNYSYKDLVVFKKKLLSNGRVTIKFVLPKDPVTIYSKGFAPNGKVNRCTDEHYNTEGDFWYFWNPKKTGCPIKPEDLVEVSANLNPIPNTKLTFPYYKTLLGDNGNGRKFQITYLVGIDEDFKKGDLGRQTFEDAVKLLKASGFKIAAGGTVRQKTLTLSKPDFDVEVSMKLMDPGSTSFVKEAAAGLEGADVFIYDGHSGLGGYLELGRFQAELGRKLKVPADKSQIYYFNGCSTFAYYNADYFKLKATAQDPEGRTNLDIITTSIGASFDIGARHDVTLINALVQGDKPSWQKIMNDTYKVDRYQTALTHVNGDEDNPNTP